MKKVLILILVIIIVFFVWQLLSREEGVIQTSPSPSPTPTPTPTPTPEVMIEPKEVVIDRTKEGFQPSEAVINAGDTVKFVNLTNQLSWPASGIHPTHEFYPGSGITKCGTPEAGIIFDACRGLKNGESFSFTFTFAFKGTWPFHDHLQPSLKGKIIVE